MYVRVRNYKCLGVGGMHFVSAIIYKIKFVYTRPIYLSFVLSYTRVKLID